MMAALAIVPSAGSVDFTQAAAGAAIVTAPRHPGFDTTRLARVDQFIEQQVTGKKLPGAVLLLARRGEVASLKAFGVADAASGRQMTTDSLFRMASATKIVTSVGLLTLHEEGRIGLGDAVSDHLP